MRSLSKCLLIIIAMAISTITYAGSLIELVKSATVPCEGCYFAVFDKVKEDYKLTYITPNTPDMATVVKNKQEVLWVNASGDYSPYWHWSKNYKEDDYQTSFKFGLCESGLGTETKYECASSFWSNTAIKDAAYSLGIYPALLIAFSPLTGMYAYNVKINKNLVESVKKGLDQYQPSITACSYQLPNILNIDDIQNINSANFSELADSQKLYAFKNSERIECLNLKDFMRVKSISSNQYLYLPTTENRTNRNAIIINNNNGAIDVGFGNFFTYDDCPVSREGFNYNYLDLAVDDFDTSKINNGYFIYKNKSEIGCINTKNYNFFKKTTSNQKIIAFIPKESTRAIVITKNNTNAQIENIKISSLSDENLFWFHKKINILSEKDVVISLRDIQNKKQEQLSNLNLKVEEAVQKFLSIPLVREPSLPPTPTLLKGEFEKEAAFKERVLLEINKREAQVIALQEKYRADVEARNTEVEKRINAKDSYADFIAKRYFESLMGGVMLKNAHYDPEKEMMYADLVSARSDFSRPLAIPILLANNEAETIKRYIDSDYKSLGINAKFSVDRNGITLNEVELFANGKPYIAQFQAEKFSPKIVEVTLPDTQAKLDTLFQNPNLADLITIPKLSFAAKTADGSIVFDDDLANDVKNLPTAPEDAKKWLFLVAVENYKETDKVLFAKHSADLLATTLKKRLGVSDRNAYVLIDGNATAGAISDKLEQMLANIKADDTIYFYYSGHGVPDPVTTEPYILPSDKVVDFIVREKQFQLGDIYRRLSLSGAGKVVAFVDSCFSGRTDNASIFKGTAPGLIRVKELDIDPTKMTVLTAGKNTQFSNAYDTKGHRMFSYFLIRSLLKSRTNTPDMNTIFQEVSVGVRDASSAKGDIYLQEPQMYGNSALPL
jgi:hypothetical protein